MREAAGWLERCPALAHAALASVKATNPNRSPERTAEWLRMVLPSTVSCVHLLAIPGDKRHYPRPGHLFRTGAVG